MPEMLLLEELESADWVAESLEKVEETLRNAAQVVGKLLEKIKGTALAYENAWRKIVANVAKGKTTEMQATRSDLLNDFDKRLGFLKQTHSLLTGLHNRGRADLDPDFLLPEIASMERLKDRVFDRWRTAEDLEHLAVRDYPLTTAELDQIGPQRRPPDSWYAEESKPF